MVPARPLASRRLVPVLPFRARAWRPRVPGTWRGVTLVALGALVLYQLAVLAALWWQGHRDDRRAVDAILVLGAAQWNGQPSPVLQARLDHAVDLYRQGYASRIAVTGGVGDGDLYSEAGVAARYLQEQGIPLLAILMEDRGRNSLESIRGAADVLAARGLSRVLLVSDPPHMLRILHMARSAGLEAYGSPATASPSVGSVSAQTRFLLRELLLYHGYQWLHLAPGVRVERPGPTPRQGSSELRPAA